MRQQFPRTVVGGVSVSRMIIGSNWMAGYSHRSNACDKTIREKFSETGPFVHMFDEFLPHGIDTIMWIGGGKDDLFNQSIEIAKEKHNKDIIKIMTPVINVEDSAKGREEARQKIRECKEGCATFCFPHHASAEQLVCKGTRTIDRLPDYLYMIREEGMIPGLSAHMPELIIYSDLNEYDVESYIQIYNCMGFLMQVEVEYIHNVIWEAKKPVMTIKAMAAGRTTPFVGLNFSWSTLREQDMVTVGCASPDEVIEDIEISFAAIERRRPDFSKRTSPGAGASSIIK